MLTFIHIKESRGSFVLAPIHPLRAESTPASWAEALNATGRIIELFLAGQWRNHIQYMPSVTHELSPDDGYIETTLHIPDMGISMLDDLTEDIKRLFP